jgi:hypothetical protein
MKNKQFFTGLTALLLSIGLAVAGCDNGSTDDGPSGPTAAELAATLAATLNGLTENSAVADGAVVTLIDGVTIDGATVTVPGGVTLVVPSTKTLTVEGTLAVAGAVTVPTGGVLEVRTGSFDGSTGTITVASGGKYVTGKTGPQLFGAGAGSVVLNYGALAGSNDAVTEHGTAIGADWLGTTAPTESWRYDPRIALTAEGSKVTIDKTGFKIEGTATVTRLTIKAETMTIAGTVTLQSNYPEQKHGIKVDDENAKIKLVAGGSLKCVEDAVTIKYVADSGNTFKTTTFEGLKADGDYSASDALSVTDSHTTLTWTDSAWVPSP